MQQLNLNGEEREQRRERRAGRGIDPNLLLDCPGTFMAPAIFLAVLASPAVLLAAQGVSLYNDFSLKNMLRQAVNTAAAAGAGVGVALAIPNDQSLEVKVLSISLAASLAGCGMWAVQKGVEKLATCLRNAPGDAAENEPGEYRLMEPDSAAASV